MPVCVLYMGPVCVVLNSMYICEGYDWGQCESEFTTD